VFGLDVSRGLWGGGGGATQTPPSSAPPAQTSTPPAQAQSIGGTWHLFTTVPAGAATLFIAEYGNMRVKNNGGPAFGAGAAVVNGMDDVSGSYHARAIQPNPTMPPAPSRDCTIDGKVVQRVSMQLVVHCTDTAGAATE
jgi:hypothetical protein